MLKKFLGLCPVLIMSDNIINAVSLGLVLTCILIFSNVTISFFQKFIEKETRIPIYLIIITTIVTCLDMIIHAFYFQLYRSIGTMIPLMITNCSILSRAEILASKKNIFFSLLDGIKTGFLSIVILFFIGAFREIVGHGTIFNHAETLLGSWSKILYVKIFHFENAISFFTLVPGALVSIGLLFAGTRMIDDFFIHLKNKR